MKKIILYHGTDIESSKKISKSGLKPSKSHWDNCPSHDDHVYLTDTFPIRFGISKAGSVSDDDYKIAIIKIEVSEDDLYPDEDYMAQIPKQFYEVFGLDKEIAKMELIEKTLYYRDNIEKYKEFWKQSLDLLGTCSHKGRIKSKKIKEIHKLELNDESYLINMSAEINFGYLDNYKKFHQLELDVLLGKKLLRCEKEMLNKLRQRVSVYNVIQTKLLMDKLNKCFYHTTGNPNVDDELFWQDGQLIFSTVLHDLIKIENPNVDLSEVNNISVDVNRLVKDDEVEIKYSIQQQEHRAKDMAMKYLESNYK